MKRLLLAGVAASSLASTGVAQELPRFEVASVRAHRAADDVMFALDFHDGGRFTAIGTLRMLIRTAYRLQDFQIMAGAAWMDDERFDIDARAARAASPDEMRLMLRELLRDRFGLTLRQEVRDVPVYALRAADAGATLGTRLRRPPVDCGARAQVAGDAPVNVNGELIACGVRLAPGGLTARGVTMALLADELSRWVDRIVTDETGLNGEFDVDLDWTPSHLQPPALLAAPAPPIAIEPDWPSLFTSVREQLGLSLEPGRGLAQVFVIARAERPAAN